MKENENTQLNLDNENQGPQQEGSHQDEPQANQDLISLQSEVKALKDDNQLLKDSLEREHTKNEELSSSVLGLKDELKKFKEAYAEQFETKTVNKDTVKTESNKTFNSLSSEIFDLISK